MAEPPACTSTTATPAAAPVDNITTLWEWRAPIVTWLTSATPIRLVGWLGVRKRCARVATASDTGELDLGASIRSHMKATGWRQQFAVLTFFADHSVLHCFDEPESLAARSSIVLDSSSVVNSYSPYQLELYAPLERVAGSYFTITTGGFTYPLLAPNPFELARWLDRIVDAINVVATPSIAADELRRARASSQVPVFSSTRASVALDATMLAALAEMHRTGGTTDASTATRVPQPAPSTKTTNAVSLSSISSAALEATAPISSAPPTIGASRSYSPVTSRTPSPPTDPTTTTTTATTTTAIQPSLPVPLSFLPPPMPQDSPPSPPPTLASSPPAVAIAIEPAPLLTTNRVAHLHHASRRDCQSMPPGNASPLSFSDPTNSSASLSGSGPVIAASHRGFLSSSAQQVPTSSTASTTPSTTTTTSSLPTSLPTIDITPIITTSASAPPVATSPAATTAVIGKQRAISTSDDATPLLTALPSLPLHKKKKHRTRSMFIGTRAELDATVPRDL